MPELSLPSLRAKGESYLNKLESLKAQVLTNTILIGQVPPIFLNNKEDEVRHSRISLRAREYVQRLSELNIPEASIDYGGNAMAVIKGKDEKAPPIIVAAHMDTVYPFTQEIHLSIDGKNIKGPGIIDNSLSLGVQLSLAEILNQVNLELESNIILLGLSESLGKSNLKGIRDFLESWDKPLKGALILEGGELGRLNYYSRSMIRGNIRCEIPMISGWENKYGNNAILILNDIINHIMEINLPSRPHTQIIIGKIRGGIKHGDLALSAKLGFEIESNSDQIVERIYSEIEDIIDSTSHENQVKIELETISNVNASRLKYNHPLVKSGIQILETLNIKPVIESSESELSIFLSHNIPAITIGLSHGENYHSEEATAEIEPLKKGITQVLLLLENLDKGYSHD